MIRTVLGDIKESEMGITFCHEHIMMDLSRIRNETDSVLSIVDDMEEELNHAVKKGLKTVVEVSNLGMGRNVVGLKKISEDLGIHIVASTGFYKEEYYPNLVFEESIDKISEGFIKEIEIGIKDTNIKAGIIAEIGTSYKKISPVEKKVFTAAAKAHLKTGVPISTHCELGTMASEQVELLLNEGVNPSKLIIGHMDLNEDIDEIIRILKKGVNVAFDTIGKNSYTKEENRIKNLLTILDKGYINSIVLSQDITRKSYLQKNGGIGFTYIFDNFIPRLKENGFTTELLEQMLIKNPSRILNFIK